MYLAGGVAPGTNEAAAWRAFLEPLGMAFVDGYNGLYDSGPLTVDSPLFRGLPSIGAGNGQSIRMTGTNLNSVALHRVGDEILYAAYQECGRRPLDATKKWEWRGSTVAPAWKEVISTPLVANMNDDNEDGQIDARDVPDVVFVTTQHLGGGDGVFSDGIVRAVNGRDGTALFDGTATDARVRSMANIAVADVDNDGSPEIVAVQANTVVILSARGAVERVIGPIEVPAYYFGAPVIADLDGDGVVEIVVGRAVLSAEGQTRFTMGAPQHEFGSIPVVADLDGDGYLEVVLGFSAYAHDGRQLFQRPERDGYPAVADLDGDGVAEIVVAGQGRLYYLDANGGERWPAASIGSGRGGPPTVADFDGDGRPDVGVASANYYSVFDGTGRLKWRQPISDFSSNITGSTAFDFDGDGVADALYADENYLRVFRGLDGAVLFMEANPSCTLTEYPVVADVDGDGHADILAGMNQICGYGSRTGVLDSGLTVWASASVPWAPTRRIWNQHAYSITNITEDGRVPRSVSPNWKVPGLNNFRLNTQLPSEGGVASLTLGIDHRLPGVAGFTVMSDTVSPAADASTEMAVRWTETIAPGGGSRRTFSVDGAVTGMIPGEVRAISDGTVVTGRFSDERGQDVSTTVTLPPLYVMRAFTPGPALTLLPSTQDVRTGQQADFVVDVRNARTTTEEVLVRVVGLDGLAVTLPSTVTLLPGAARAVPLRIAVPESGSPWRRDIRSHGRVPGRGGCLHDRNAPRRSSAEHATGHRGTAPNADHRAQSGRHLPGPRYQHRHDCRDVRPRRRHVLRGAGDGRPQYSDPAALARWLNHRAVARSWSRRTTNA